MSTAAAPSVSSASRAISVASVPASHVYVRHLGDPDGQDAVARLPDPVPADRRRVPWGWWPPLMLDPAWLEANAERFDLLHVHFGFDEKTPAELRDVLACLRELERPLVYTVHDLRNPHQRDRGMHDDLLDVLVPGADALITLTPGAAAEIERRWGKRALVLAHPHVLELDRLARRRHMRAEFVIGVHAKSVRASMDPLAVVEALAGLVPELPGARLRVDLHDEVYDPSSFWHNPGVGRALRTLAERDAIDLRVHPYFEDEQLWDYLAGLDVSVLPYRFGTHSGWLEACYDLGTAVIAPDCGFFAEQGPVLSYHHDEDGLDPDSLARAVLLAYERRPCWQATRAERVGERRRVAGAHRRLYERLLGR
jgi:glycosyltransferase involved in cell wall biosynthesis